MDKTLIDKITNEMLECAISDNCVSAHVKADQLLITLIRELGYNEIADAYDEIGKLHGQFNLK